MDFLGPLFSKSLYLVAPLSLWALLMAAWEAFTGTPGSQPDWYGVATLIVPIPITVVLRKHIRWLAGLSVVAASVTMVLFG